MTCFKPCAVTRVASLALNFKQNMQGGWRGLPGGAGGGGKRGGLRLFGIQQADMESRYLGPVP